MASIAMAAHQPIYVDMADRDGKSTVIVVAHVTHLTQHSATQSKVHLTGGDGAIVSGTINELVQRFWPR